MVVFHNIAPKSFVDSVIGARHRSVMSRVGYRVMKPRYHDMVVFYNIAPKCFVDCVIGARH